LPHLEKWAYPDVLKVMKLTSAMVLNGNSAFPERGVVDVGGFVSVYPDLNVVSFAEDAIVVPFSWVIAVSGYGIEAVQFFFAGRKYPTFLYARDPVCWSKISHW
jgi:hypothetical protein